MHNNIHEIKKKLLIDINDLEKVFPNKLPENVISQDNLAYLIGQQKVISYLNNLYRKSMKDNVSTKSP